MPDIRLSMPGNDSGDRVHNFFEPDNLFQGHHHQQNVEGTWPVGNNNFWVGGQLGLPKMSTKNDNIQHSATLRDQGSHTLHGQSGLNFTQTSSNFAQNLVQRQQLNSNGYMFGNHVNQTRQDGANIFTADTTSDHHNQVSKGSSMYESHQGPGFHQHQTKPLVRSETSESPLTFKLFGNQQQMHYPQSSMTQSFQKQQSGFHDMQQLQQQIMLRKMQELQRQQQLCQPDGLQQNAVNPISPFPKQLTGSYPSGTVNGPLSADSQNSSWGTEIGNRNWLQRASSAVQGSPNGFVTSANHAQAQSSISSRMQQGDQLCGDTFSGSRGNLTQFSEITTVKPSMGQVAAFANNTPANQYQACVNQTSMLEESMTSRLGFPGDNAFCNHPGRQTDSMKRIASSQEIHNEAGPQDKTLSEDVASQNEVSLDPAEARILYGSEENIWAAFGESLDDCEDASGPFDQFQSGTWTALMHSAVAETFSNHVARQEVLGGLNLPNTLTRSENQPLTHNGRQETSFHNDMPSPLNLSVLNPDSSVNNNHQNISGVQQPGNKLSFEPGQRQGSSYQREVSNISSPGVLQNAITDMRPTHGSMLHSGVPETNRGSYKGPWSPAHSGLRDQNGKSGVYNPSESAACFIDAVKHEPDNSSLHSQGYGQKKGMKGEVGLGGFSFNSCPMPSSVTEVDHANSLSSNTPATRGDFIVSNSCVTPNLSSTQPNEFSQAMLWRNINSTALSYGSGSVDRPHHHIEQENRRDHSSLNSRNKANADTSEMGNCNRYDSSNNSYCSDLSHNNSSGGVNGNVMSDVGDLHSLPSGKRTYLNHDKIGKPNLGPHKFLINSIKNADEDTHHHHGVKHSSQSLISQQATDFESFEAFSQVPKGSVDWEKGQSADKKDANDIDDSCVNIPSHIHNSALPFNQHADVCTPVKDTPSSQNMLELLHKIDQLRGHGFLIHTSPSVGHIVSSELPETENCGSSASFLQQNHNSTSQGFGLQLGPPTHWTGLPSQSFIPQVSLQKRNNSHQSQDAPDNGERDRSQLPSSPVVHSLPRPSEREFNPNRSTLPEQVNNAFINKMPGSYVSTSSSECPHSRSLFQYQQMVKESGQVSKNQQDTCHSIQKNDSPCRSSSIGQTTESTFHGAAWNSQLDDSDLSKGTSNQISSPGSHLRDLIPPASAKDVSVSHAMNSNAQQGTSFEMLPHMWSNIPGHPHLLSSHIHTTSSNVWQLHQPNVLESNSFPHKLGEQESIAGRISPSVSGSSSMNKGSPAQHDSTGKVNIVQRDELHRPEPALNNVLDNSLSNSVSKQKDIEAFGQPLMSNNSSHQNYSLLHQMRIMKSAETDRNERARKRMKSAGSVGECQQLISKVAKSINNAVGQHTSISPGDSKIPSFSGLADNAGSKAYAQLGNLISQNIHTSNQGNSPFNHDGNNPTPVKVDHLCTSPQMTPSWLIQNGGFRNGHMLTGYDARRGMVSKTSESLSSHGKTFSSVHMSNSNEPVTAADIGPEQIDNIQQIPVPISEAVEPQSLVLNVKKTKKWERVTFQLTSWCKEVSQESQNPQTISMAELRWAKAANRLTQKIEAGVIFSEDGLPMLRAKTRVILTTQLMQQLLSPPKSAILSLEAELNYDGVAYSVSRLALGEACGLLPNLNSDSDKSHHVVSLCSGNYDELGKVNDQHLSKLVEGFTVRAQKLESDFLRLDNRASLVDVRSESQELEKFSVINQFAKIHGRGQAETGDASSSSRGAANALRPYPQRYVTALPVPRDLPDNVHCLSL